MIDSYDFGHIVIDGEEITHDLILSGGEVINWWRKEGHSIAIEDLKDLPDDFEVLVIGNGASGCCKVPDETIDYISQHRMHHL